MHLFFKTFILSVFFLLFLSCQSNDNLSSANGKNITTLAPLSSFNPETIDGLLASVGDQSILLSDFQHAIYISSKGQTQILPNGKLVGGTIDSDQASQVLDSLINQKVLEIKAQELGIDISKAELTERINYFLKQQQFTENDLEVQLKKSGSNMEDYRQQFKNEIVKQELIAKVISPVVTVTEDEVNNYYLNETGGKKYMTAVKLRSLMLNLPENITDINEFEPVVSIQDQIAKGANFVDLVNLYSKQSDVAQTQGILPSRPVNQLPTEIQEKLENLKINDVIGPFHIANSVFFFQYLGAEFGRGSDLKSNYMSWKNKLLNTKFEEKLADYLKKERTILRVNIRPFIISR